jgi:hypothetical protein
MKKQIPIEFVNSGFKVPVIYGPGPAWIDLDNVIVLLVIKKKLDYPVDRIDSFSQACKVAEQ